MSRYEKLNHEKLTEKRIVRVGVYARVSTDKEDQANSFESQKRYFKEYIERREGWELVEVFADEGSTGTSTKKRKAFNRMIDCARNGEIDLIVTKEISRFARNTLDSIFYTRDLKKHGVGVFFLNDNIHTLDPDAELRLTIMASIAQEESRKTSNRVKWGQKRRMEQGVVFGRDMLGYDVRNGRLYINKDGAETVRLIFDKFVHEGKGTHVIARELREAGMPTSTHMKQWSNTVILRVLRNEKYCGDLVQKKTITPDYLSHDKKYNRGEEDFIIQKDHHEPIVSRELFNRANGILDSRALSPEGKAKHSNRYVFSGKIKCGRCGASYVARYKKRKDGSQYKSWSCFGASRHGKPHINTPGKQMRCTAESIRNEDALYIMRLVCSSLDTDRNTIVSNMVQAIGDIVKADHSIIDTIKLKSKILQVKDKRARLVDLYVSGNITRTEFISAREKCEEETADIKNLIESVEKPERLLQKQQSLLRDIEKSVYDMLHSPVYEEKLYRDILDKIVIRDKDHIDVFLRLLPFKWSYTVAKESNKGRGDKRNISDTSLPISVSNPFNSGYGMV